MSTLTESPAWQRDVFDILKAGGVKQIAYVPDAGHSYTIRAAAADPEITTESDHRRAGQRPLR